MTKYKSRIQKYLFEICGCAVHQWSPHFLPEDQISYYTTIRAPDICNEIVSGYVTF